MTVKQRQALLCYMGTLAPEDIDGLWGGVSAAATAGAQRILGIPDDGVWGDQTDAAIREHIYAGEDIIAPPPATGDWWDGIRHWTREEFRCRCGEYHAPYCDGFPVEPDRTLVELVDDLRHRLSAPGIRSSGIRCARHNADQPGSVSNSRHLTGKALDFRIVDVSAADLLAAAQADPRCRYAYIIGNGPYVHVDVE